MYLQKRRRLWYALHDIPEDVRPILGKPRYVKSLETEDRREAQRRAALLEAHWRLEIDRARKQSGCDPLEEEARFFRRVLAEAHDHEREFVMEAVREKAAAIVEDTIPPFADPASEEIREHPAQKVAERFYDMATGQLIRFDEHIEEWIATLANEPKTKDMKKATATKFAEEFPLVQDVTRKAVQRWASKEIQEGTKSKTVRRMLSELRSYWSFLISLEAAPEDASPFDKLTMPKGGKSDGVEDNRRAFKPEDVVRILDAATAKGDAQLADLIRLGMWSGARIEELCALKVTNVHSDHFDIRDAKTPAGWRLVPIHPKLAPTVARLRADSKDGYLLSGLTANKYEDRSNAIGKRFGRLKTKMEFGRGYVFHSIRKTVATLLENAGVNENVAADLIGHEKPTMTYGLYSDGNALKVLSAALRKINYPGM